MFFRKGSRKLGGVADETSRRTVWACKFMKTSKPLKLDVNSKPCDGNEIYYYNEMVNNTAVRCTTIIINMT